MYELICKDENCNKSFFSSKKRTKYCSHACYNQNRTPHGPRRRIKLICQNNNCRQEFDVSPCYTHRIYCSASCQQDTYKEKSVKLVCQLSECGKEFNVIDYYKDRKFCSKDCYIKNRQTDMKKAKEFYRRELEFKRFYGLSFKEVIFLKTIHCMICNKSNLMRIDHNHKTKNCFRGVLCNHCNVGLGWVEANLIETTSIVKDYLSKEKRTIDECLDFKKKWWDKYVF